MILGALSVFGIIFLIVGIFLFIYGLYSFKNKRLIENTPTSKIRSIAMGLVEIVGAVKPYKEHILKSPFTQNDCVYYYYRVEEYRKSGKNSHWVTIKKDEGFRHFYLKDETGVVLVDPLHAKIDISRKNVFESSIGRDPPEKVKQFLADENIRFEGRLLGINKTMRYTEKYIAPNDNLYIMGTASDNPFVKEGSADIGVEDVMIQKGKNEKNFIISDKSEKGLIRLDNIKMIAGITLGSFLIVLGTIIFL